MPVKPFSYAEYQAKFGDELALAILAIAELGPTEGFQMPCEATHTAKNRCPLAGRAYRLARAAGFQVLTKCHTSTFYCVRVPDPTVIPAGAPVVCHVD